MRARTSRRAALLVAVAAFGAAAFVTPNAVADHSVVANDDRQWIAQAGDGGGSSQSINEPQGLPIIEDMNVLSVLYHPRRFPFQTGAARPGFGRYVAFGLTRVQPDPLHDTIVSQLAVSHSENGLRWSAPQPATIRDPDGVDVPFILNEPDSFFDVVYTSTPVHPQLPLAQFTIIYRTLDGDIFDIGSLHNAWSDDGQTWYMDAPITQDAANPVITGACCASFKSGSYGPTDLIFQPNRSNAATCATADPDGAGPLGPTPWNCRWVMLYDATDGATEHVGIASSTNGLSWRGHPTPLLAAGAAGAWDDDAATLAKVRIRPSANGALLGQLYDLYYSGGRGPDDACYGGLAGCWSLGTATASNEGLVFTKTAANPVTPHQLLEVFGPDDPHTLWAPSVVDDAGQDGNGSSHSRIYYTRITNGQPGVFPSRDMYLAYTEPAPTQAPRIRISEPSTISSPGFPQPFRNRADTPIVFTMTDTLGTPGLIGVDLSSLVIQIDGSPAAGSIAFVSPHLVNALKFPAIRASIDGAANLLTDGLHTVSVQVADLEGNVGVATRSFVVDTIAPATIINSAPADGRIGFPVSSAGTFVGRTTELPTGTAIDRLDVTVTNPLGMAKTYEVKGGLVNKLTPRIWEWAWVAPTPDTHFLLPGFYQFSFRGADVAQNREEITEDNTISVLIL